MLTSTYKESMYNFGGWLRARREALGLTQDQLADRSGYSQEAISAWERGSYRADLRQRHRLANLATALQVPLPELLAQLQEDLPTPSPGPFEQMQERMESFERALSQLKARVDALERRSRPR